MCNGKKQNHALKLDTGFGSLISLIQALTLNGPIPGKVKKLS